MTSNLCDPELHSDSPRWLPLPSYLSHVYPDWFKYCRSSKIKTLNQDLMNKIARMERTVFTLVRHNEGLLAEVWRITHPTNPTEESRSRGHLSFYNIHDKIISIFYLLTLDHQWCRGAEKTYFGEMGPLKSPNNPLPLRHSHPYFGVFDRVWNKLPQGDSMRELLWRQHGGFQNSAVFFNRFSQPFWFCWIALKSWQYHSFNLFTWI